MGWLSKLKNLGKGLMDINVDPRTGELREGPQVQGYASIPITPAGGVASLPTASKIASKVSSGLKAVGQWAWKNPKTALTTSIATPVIAGIFRESPKEVTKAVYTSSKTAVTEGVPALYNVGKTSSSFVKDPSMENLTKIGKENPIATSVIGAGALTLAGLGVAKWVPSVILGSKIDDLEETIGDMKTMPTDQLPSLPITTPKETGGSIATTPSPILPKEKEVPTDDAVIKTPEMQTITTGEDEKPKKKKKDPSINIKINNSSKSISGRRRHHHHRPCRRKVYKRRKYC